jgi:hypothetical protein
LYIVYEVVGELITLMQVPVAEGVLNLSKGIFTDGDNVQGSFALGN